MAGVELDQKTQTNNESQKETVVNEKGSGKKNVELAVESVTDIDELERVEKEAITPSAFKNESDGSAAEKEDEAELIVQKEAVDGLEKTDEAEPAVQKEAQHGEANNDRRKDEIEGDKTKDEGKKNGENPIAGGESTPFSSFQQRSSNQNAFTGLAGGGFSEFKISVRATPKNLVFIWGGFSFWVRS
ncbi:hypothetical protein Nepgr_017795 [Nepenthes gracilis]|uniref:Uncharacterized protein n=1 Tax=Nepenthes gracilis TaxID=150966 RepID=A0AAD3SSB5_NEPGR|nr:hypothetical protein Nepgr_017795 [Nepenthes gracilis]